MAATQYPLPRELRETAILVGNGTAGPYGPTIFKVFDAVDVEVWWRAEDETDFTKASVTVAKTSGLALDTVSVTFAENVPATTEFLIASRRLHERSVAVTKAGTIDSDQLEKELSKQGSVLDELRRDIRRGGSPVTGSLGQTLVFGADGGVLPGADQSDIVSAQAYASQASVSAIAVAQALAIFQAGGLNPFPVSRALLKAADPNTLKVAFLKEAGREGNFAWDQSDLSAQMVMNTIASVSVDAAANTYSMRSVTTTSVNSGTDTLTAIAHGFVNDELVTVPATVNGLIAGGQYYIYNATADTFQLRTSLTAGSAVDLTGTTNVTVRGQHGITTGMAAIVTSAANGLVTNTLYYLRRVNEAVWSVHTTPQNAMDNVAIDIIGTANQTFKVIADPVEARFILRNGAPLDGSAGAWVRQSPHINVRHAGAVPNAESWYPIQASIWLGYFLKLPTYVPASGRLTPYFSAYSLRHFTNTKLAVALLGSSMRRPDNGINLLGDGEEITVIRCAAAFPDSNYLLHLDGNANSVAQVVGSNPYAQGMTHVADISFQGRGAATGTAVKGLGFRACWGLIVDRCEFVGFSGTTVEHLSAAGAGTGQDDVDTSTRLVFRNFKLLSGGGDGFRCTIARPTHLLLENFEIADFPENGFVGGPVNSIFRNGVVTACGKDGVTTTGGIRLVNALTSTGSSSLCRNALLENITFENNWNYEFNPQQVIGLTVIGGTYNLFHPTPDPAGKCAVRVGTGCQKMTVIGGHFPTYSGADIPYFDIASGATDIMLIGPSFLHATAHVTLQSGVRFKIDQVPNDTDIAFTGSQPVDSYMNGRSLGLQTFTPTISGTGITYTAQAGYKRMIAPDLMWFQMTVAWSANSGAVDLEISGFGSNAVVTSIVEMQFSLLTYTSPPQAVVLASTNKVLLRQSASNAAIANIQTEAAATLVISGTILVAPA